MKPKRTKRTGQDDLFRTRLSDIVNPRHALVRLADLIDWRFFEETIEPLYADVGRCGVAVRFMAGLHILKHVYGLSDEEVCERWVESPYFQYFTGEEHFAHDLPHDRSNMSNHVLGLDPGMAQACQRRRACSADPGEPAHRS